MGSILSDLYGKYGRWLRARLRAGGPDDAEDVVHETFLRLMRDPERPEIRSPRAFLSTVATNLRRDAGRAAASSGGSALALDDVPAALAPWVRPDQENALLLKQVILALPPVYRDTFIFNRFMGLTYAEIAQRLGVSEKTVEYRMSRALALCQEALRD